MASLDRAQLERMIADGKVDTVVCCMPDLWGRLLGKRLTGKTFLRSALTDEGLHGSLYVFIVDMDMDPRPGYALTDWDTGFFDCRYVPDLATLRLVPWMERTALVICDPYHETEDEPLPIGPRNILKRQVAAAKRHGLTVKAASELEFFTYRDSFDEAWKKGYHDLETTSNYRADYHILHSTLDEYFIGEMRRHLEAFDVEIEFSKTEWGLGQQEINLRYVDVLEMADRHALYKLAVKEMMGLQGMSASFMAKIGANEIGSSCHVHLSLWDEAGGTPVSWDAEAPGHMAASFGQFVAGLLATSSELILLSAPNVNSYKRLIPDSFAPARVAVGDDNRTCAYRLLGHGPSFRVENRIPGADVNPYLAYAAQLAGGLHGIESGLAAPAVYQGNAYHDETLERVPHTLRLAIDAFAESTVARAAFGDEVTDHLLTFGRHELKAFESEAVTDWELKRYFERV